MTQSDKKEKDKEMRKAESVPEKGKKLSRKAADKLKFYGVAAVLSLLCLLYTSRQKGTGWNGRYRDSGMTRYWQARCSPSRLIMTMTCWMWGKW